MHAAMNLAYLVFSVRKPQRWMQFCDTMLGLPAPVSNSDGSFGYRLDAASQRLILTEGRADDLAALGLECADDNALDAVLERLRAAGQAPLAAGAAAAAARRVRRLYLLDDPEGNRVELCAGLERAVAPFRSPAFPGGFRTGELGLGHAVLVSHDLAAMERFYVDALGFGVSERLATRVGPMDIRGTFLHCNRRHHTLALFEMPLRKRMHHFMLEANALADVGTAFERAQRAKVPLSLGIGQHPDPDGTFSFYGATPSGFDFEIGAGGKEIEPAQWQTLRTDVTSSWGHKPQLRLQLKMAAGLVAQKLGMQERLR